MSKELFISKMLGEMRACLIENGEILDLLHEREVPEVERLSVGNIYLGKVSRVLPGMQSAFVDIGYEKAAFLYVNDAYIPTIDEQRKINNKREELEIERENKIGQVIPDEMSSFSEISNQIRSERPIQTFLKEGDQILVQVAKEPISTKGPRITRHITLAGRHVVFMPFIEHTGVSRRIEKSKERERLREILETIRPEGKGIIARTVAEGQSYKLLKSDYDMLVKIWKDVQKKSKKVKAPHICYQDLNFLQRVLRDILDEDVTKIILDDKDAQKEAEKFINKYLPSMKGKCEFFQNGNGGMSLFEKYGVDLEIERALSNKVYLKSGGALVIDQTEALVSIDVNTGKFVGRKSLEETIVKTNLEAVKEIAYQLRVRNCGGLIIIDFIDMQTDVHKEQVYSTLLEALKKDRSKTNVMPISELGLVEMTRKRTRDTLTRIMCNVCPYCEGTGRVKTPETVCFEITRKLLSVLAKSSGRKVFIYAHPEVTAGLCSQDTDLIDILEEKFQKELVIRSENSYHIEQYEILPQKF